MAERVLRRGLSLAGVAVVVAGGIGWAVTRPTAPVSASPPVPTGTAPVTRTTIVQSEQVGGTLGYAGVHAVLAAGAPGQLTRLPAIGAIVRRGHPVYEVDGARVPLLYGGRPAWRDLVLGMTDGADVLQLERNLKALGYGADLTVDRHFSLSTHYAVKRLQRHLRLSRTGALRLGRVAFLPGALRVSARDAQPGTPLQPGAAVLHGTGLAPVVSVRLDPTMAPNLREADRVTVTMPDGRTTKGRISGISPVAQSEGGQDGGPPQTYVPVTVRLSGKVTRLLDQTTVQVAITSERHKDVLAVPIVALLAQPGGTFAVVTGGRRVSVETGLFDEVAGLVEVTGVDEGAMVEVPAP
jgi:peptidoglycan hydrolase-like protein with peptidoglycan-binding domain